MSFFNEDSLLCRIVFVCRTFFCRTFFVSEVHHTIILFPKKMLENQVRKSGFRKGFGLEVRPYSFIRSEISSQNQYCFGSVQKCDFWVGLGWVGLGEQC